ncbi:hypothetical protein [Alkalimarinus alittae]|uniref:Uncharacterized protein n=1 Tax=Alkalimarinus alittae TaxID=2961619 RepID=A0ABY6N3K9_9ALTE|nr:hypothetical protein [Alkalimarinus alittae]UZE96695.1 hypothetical protein NKI27_02775 [Alkalimarinus alittae]
MNMKNTRLHITAFDLFVALTKPCSAVSVDKNGNNGVVSSNNFSGWQYWFYYFSKTVKRTLDTR